MSGFDWVQDINYYRWQMMQEFRIFKPTSFVLITGHIESGTPEQIMEELREADPDAHAKLSEIIVIGEDGRVTEESLSLFVAMIDKATYDR
jgi:hypothetical protein